MAVKVRDRKAKPFDRVDLAEDGLLSYELQESLHDVPHEAHIAAAAQMASIDPAQIPRFDSVAGLIMWVQTVLAAGGQPAAVKLIADRLSPVVKESKEQIDLSQRGAPVASANEAERLEASNYLKILNE